MARRLYLFKKSSPSRVTYGKLDAILFCSEVNSAGYSEIEEPTRLSKTLFTREVYTKQDYIPTNIYHLQ